MLRILGKWYSQQNVILDATLSRSRTLYGKMHGYEPVKCVLAATAVAKVGFGVCLAHLCALRPSTTEACYNSPLLSIKVTNMKLMYEDRRTGTR